MKRWDLLAECLLGVLALTSLAMAVWRYAGLVIVLELSARRSRQRCLTLHYRGCTPRLMSGFDATRFRSLPIRPRLSMSPLIRSWPRSAMKWNCSVSERHSTAGKKSSRCETGCFSGWWWHGIQRDHDREQLSQGAGGERVHRGAGGRRRTEDVKELGFGHGFGQLDANRELVEWMRRYNADPSHRVEASVLRF